MKVLHINCSDEGSTGKIIREISNMCKNQGHESVLCNPKNEAKQGDDGLIKYRTSFSKEQSVYKRICYYLGFQYGFAPVSTYRIIKIIKKEKPDIIHVHSINCYMVDIYSLFRFLNENEYPIIVTNHAEFFYTGNCSHAKDCTRYLEGCRDCPDLYNATRSKIMDKSHEAWIKMRNCIQGAASIQVVSVSPWALKRSSLSPIMKGIQQRVILNGVNTKIYNNGNGAFSSKRIVLFVTASFSANDYSEKGGGYIVDLARRLQTEDAKIVVIGKIQNGKKLPDNIELIGRIEDQNKLADYYRSASLTIVVSKRETFSMPVAESLCCGTPVVGFKAGGPESIANLKYSEFVNYGDLEELEKIIKNKWLSFKTREMSEIISAESIRDYSSDRMAKEYISVYEELINEKDRNFDLS